MKQRKGNATTVFKIFFAVACAAFTTIASGNVIHAASPMVSSNDNYFTSTVYEVRSSKTGKYMLAIELPAGIVMTSNVGMVDARVFTQKKPLFKASYVPKGTLVPVYRVEDPKGPGAIYTQWTGERDKAVKELGWSDLGIAFYVDSSIGGGQQRVYRFRSPNGTFRYAQSKADQEALLRAKYVKDSKGTAFFAKSLGGAPAETDPGSSPVNSAQSSCQKSSGYLINGTCYHKKALCTASMAKTTNPATKSAYRVLCSKPESPALSTQKTGSPQSVVSASYTAKQKCLDKGMYYNAKQQCISYALHCQNLNMKLVTGTKRCTDDDGSKAGGGDSCTKSGKVWYQKNCITKQQRCQRQGKAWTKNGCIPKSTWCRQQGLLYDRGAGKCKKPETATEKCRRRLGSYWRSNGHGCYFTRTGEKCGFHYQSWLWMNTAQKARFDSRPITAENLAANSTRRWLRINSYYLPNGECGYTDKSNEEVHQHNSSETPFDGTNRVVSKARKTGKMIGL